MDRAKEKKSVSNEHTVDAKNALSKWKVAGKPKTEESILLKNKKES